MTIPFIDLKSQYKALELPIHARINTVLEHGQYIMGPEVGELEARLAEFTGSKHCITVASGTEALLISLLGLGIGRDDEVITTPFTFAATVEVIALIGAKPIFVDIEPDTCNIDARLIEAAITPRTKAIMPVSLYGQVADMDEINAIADRHGGLAVIEDAAQSFGATYKGRRSCNLSTVGCTSFFPSKPLGCYGDGGAIFTNDDDLARIFKEVRVHGQCRRYEHNRVGVGGRMDTIQCAIVLAKFDLFPTEITLRREKARHYDRGLVASGLATPTIIDACHSVYAQYTVLVDARDKLQKMLSDRGIPTAVHYPSPINQQPPYKRYCCGDCTPIARETAGRVLSLPMGPYLSIEDQDHIIEAVNACLA